MSTGLPRYNLDINNWMKFNNFFKGFSYFPEFLDIEANGNNPPTVKQYTRFMYYNTSSRTIPTGTATGDTEYAAGDTVEALETEAIFEDGGDLTFSWGGTVRGENMSSQSAGTWYLYCSGSYNNDSSTIGQGKYNISKTETPTHYDYMGGSYSSNGYKILASFVSSSSGAVSDVTSLMPNLYMGEMYWSKDSTDDKIHLNTSSGGKIMSVDNSTKNVGIKEENPDAPLHITGTDQGGDLSSIDSETLLLLQNNTDPTVTYPTSANLEFVGGYFGGANIYNSMKCGGIGQEELRINKMSMLTNPGPGTVSEGFYSKSSGGSYYFDIIANGTPGNNDKNIYIRMNGAAASTDVHTNTTTKKVFYVSCATETKEILEDAKLEEMLGLLNIPIKKYIVKDDPEQKEIYGIVLEDLERFCPHLVGRGNKEITNIEEIERAKKLKEKDDKVKIPEEETKLVGKNTALIVDNLIGICQYQQKKIEELEKRVSKLEGAK